MKFRLLLYLSFIIFFTITSCKKITTKKNNTTTTYVKESVISYNFDSILKCGYYSYNANFFVTADNGCIYKEGKNNFGNIIIYLFPKKIKNTPLNKIESYERYVNKLDINNLKKEFNIYLYLISKEYLTETPEGYYHKKKYVKKLYKYNVDLKRWKLLKSKKINSITDEQKEIKEVALFINKKNKKYEWNGKYTSWIDAPKGMDVRLGVQYELNLKIDSVLFSKESYSTDFKYLCKVKQEKDTLYISYYKTISGTEPEKAPVYKMYKNNNNTYIISTQIYDMNGINNIPILFNKE